MVLWPEHEEGGGGASTWGECLLLLASGLVLLRWIGDAVSRDLFVMTAVDESRDGAFVKLSMRHATGGKL